MSTTYYTTLPEDYLDFVFAFRKDRHIPDEFRTHVITLHINGWSARYLQSVFSRQTSPQFVTTTLRDFRNQDFTKFDLPIVPQPHTYSPHIIKLRSVYDKALTDSSRVDLPIQDIPAPLQSQLRTLYLRFRSTRLYTPKSDYLNSPKWYNLSRLAPHLLFYYSLGVPAETLTTYMTDGEQTLNTVTYRILKAYYQWPTPFIHPKRQRIFSLISSQQILPMTREMLNRLNPSPQNLELLSQIPFSTRYGKDLTLQKHLFRRESYRTLFPALPEAGILLSPTGERLSVSHAQELVDAVLV